MNKIEFEYFFKAKLAENGLNITKLAKMLNTTSQNLCNKIKKATFNYVEMYNIPENLGYRIEWVRTDKQ